MRGWLFGQAIGASFFKLFSDFYKRSYAKSADKHRAGTKAAGDLTQQHLKAKKVY